MCFSLDSAAVHWCWVTAHLHEERISAGVFAVTQACCEPVIQSSTGRLGIHLIPSRAAEHWCWVTADLYEEPIILGAFAVTQACCQPVLQSSTGHMRMHLILNSADLYEQPKSTGVIAVTQACCQPVLQSSIAVGTASWPDQCCSAFVESLCT